MSNQEDNTNNRKLKDFLDKNKISDNSGMDDFEKEALEGFATLDNEKEALDLKSSLDSKIYKEVFAEEKKSAKIIWYAAAGLLLLIGFSVYFMLNNPVLKREDLAVQSQLPRTDEIQKSLEDVAKENENLQFKKVEKSVEKSAPAQKNSEAKSELSKQVKRDEAEKTISNQNSDTEKALEEIVASESKPQAAPALAPMEDKREMMQPSAGSGAISLGTSSSQNDKSSFSVAKNDEKIYAVEVQKSKASRSKKSSNNEGKIAAEDENYTIAGPSSTTCYYSGGEDVLSKDLKNILSSKNLSQKFDATLFINENKKVEKVIFTNTYDLNKTQQKELVELLKTLNKFNVTGASGKSLAEFKLVYRP